MGRKPEPTALKIVKGVRESRINREEPLPNEGEIVAPDWLSERALGIWNRLAPDMEDKGCLTPWDVDCFAVFCNAVAVYRECAAMMGSKYLDKGGAGGVIKSPYWQIMRDCADTMAKFSSRFGLTPSDRQALKAGDDTNAPTSGAERMFG